MFGADSGENLENGITSYHAVLSFTLFAIKSTQHPIDLEIPEGLVMYWWAQLLASKRKDLLFFCFSFGMHACQTRVTFTKFQTFSSSAGISTLLRGEWRLECFESSKKLICCNCLLFETLIFAMYKKSRCFSAMRVGLCREKNLPRYWQNVSKLQHQRCFNTGKLIIRCII